MHDTPAEPSVAHAAIFDLDGTLLDHHSYSWAAAEPALARVRALQIPLVLVTSKTAAELEVLRRQLDLPHPFDLADPKISHPHLLSSRARPKPSSAPRGGEKVPA